jgi:Beta-xylosidase
MKMNHLALTMGAVLAITGCGGSGKDRIPQSDLIPDNAGQAPVYDDPTADGSAIAFNDLAVHDPSVIKTGDTYYVFGSHLSAAQSTDLMTWEYIPVGDGNTMGGILPEDIEASPLFNTYSSEIPEGIAWTGGYIGSWASDVIQLADDKYYFYYSHCTQPDTGECWGPRSYLGVAVSDTISGPYSKIETFIYSGQDTNLYPDDQDELDLMGIESYDAAVHPNAIDPDAFFDKDGNLWMVYGSYSGGIYILAMDETTGLPEPGQSYGKHIAGGTHSAIEGPYVFYSPESDYYYLMASFGGFNANDGYHVRMARSRTPDGPYLDASGQDMVNAKGGWDAIQEYGVKLIDSFEFASDLGDDVGALAYLAPGHNSAIYDEATGKHLLIMHTRFPNRGQEHSIRVHEMMVNADGWLVASPHRFAPQTGANMVDFNDMLGDYKLVLSGTGFNRDTVPTSYVTLSADLQISGQQTGNYHVFSDQPNRVVLNLRGTSYEGVASWQWNEASETLVPTISAVSTSGAILLATQQAEMSNTDVLQAVADDIQYPENFVGKTISLPDFGTRGVDITWETSDDTVIRLDGNVYQPYADRGDQEVTLTATFARQGQLITESYVTTVPAKKPYDRTAMFDFEDDLSDSLGYFEDGVPTNDRPDNLDGATAEYVTGMYGQALTLDGASGVLLPAGLISNYEYTISFWYQPNANTAFTPALFGETTRGWVSFKPFNWAGEAMLWSNIDDTWFDGLSTQVINPIGEWTHLAVSVKNGAVTVTVNGVPGPVNSTLADIFSTETGLFYLGTNYWDEPLNGQVDDLRIYEAALSAGEIIALDIDKLPASELLETAVDILELPIDLTQVKGDFDLPIYGPYGSGILWASSDSSHLEVDFNVARVTQPERDEPAADVVLTATMILDGEQVTKDFNVTILNKVPPEPVAVFSFEDAVEDSTGNFTGGGDLNGFQFGEVVGDIAYGEGVTGKAISLAGGQSAGVNLPDNLITDYDYTVEMWLRPTAFFHHSTAFFGAVDGDHWVSMLPMQVDDGNSVFWAGSQPSYFDGTFNQRIPEGQWTHIITTVSSGQWATYIDGERVGGGLNFPDMLSGADTVIFSLGNNWWDTTYHGMIDELRIYDAAVNDLDAAEFYQNAVAR